MGAYRYQALNKMGKTLKGFIEADSERQARQLLREKELIPTELALLIKQTQGSTKKISAQDLALFTRQLATLLAAGLPVEESLLGVSEQTEKDKLRSIILGVRGKVLEGYSLAQALGEFPKGFPELYRATVSAGEQTGRLDAILEKLAQYAENQQAAKQKVMQALIYPTVMIVVSIGIISFLLAFVVPKIIEVFSNSGQTLPLSTVILIQASQLLRQYGLYFLITIIALLIGFQRSLKRFKVRIAWDNFLLKLPIFAYLIRSTNTARYIHTFAILFTAGVSVLETMKVSASVLTNFRMREAFTYAATRVKEGSDISVALKETGFISPMSLHLIASGEKSGQIAAMMEHAANHLDNEVKRLIDTALTLMEPLIILCMGAIVLFIVLATLLPIFSMEQLVN